MVWQPCCMTEPFVLASHMAAIPMSFGSPEIGCKPPILHETIRINCPRPRDHVRWHEYISLFCYCYRLVFQSHTQLITIRVIAMFTAQAVYRHYYFVIQIRPLLKQKISVTTANWPRLNININSDVMRNIALDIFSRKEPSILNISISSGFVKIEISALSPIIALKMHWAPGGNWDLYGVLYF